MGKIVVLDENTANQIAAGEVVERPASVVKELVENSIDAGAKSITVEIKNGGISMLRVSDNGSGIDEEDAEVAFERHATSKIRSARDLFNIHTMGFRGEALASIASVANVEMITRTKTNDSGTRMLLSGGKILERSPIGCPTGTTFIVRNLFFNTPARYKFLKKDTHEASMVTEALTRIALGYPDVSIRLVSNGTNVLHTPGNGQLMSVIQNIYGYEATQNIIEIKYKDEKCELSGYAGKPTFTRAARTHQSFFINHRYIRSRLLTSAVEETYKTLVPAGRYPFVLLNIELNPMLVDVNVHPAKLEVRFSDEFYIKNTIIAALNQALFSKNLFPETNLTQGTNVWKSEYSAPTPDFKQMTLNEEKPVVAPADEIISPAAGMKKVENIEEFEKNIVKPSTSNPFFAPQAPVAQSRFVPEKPPVATSIPANPIPAVSDSIETRPAASEIKPLIPVVQSIPIPQAPELEALNNDSPEAAIYQPLYFNIVGQAFETYIIVQVEDELYIIDQHAAHERIMYEKLIKKLEMGNNTSQMLLVPQILELTQTEQHFINENTVLLQKLGFEYETFGHNAIALRAVPVDAGMQNPGTLFMDVMDTMMSSGLKEMHQLKEYAVYTMACKMAVKANKSLAKEEIENLIAEMKGLKNPFTCPHGRPTIIRLSKNELEKRFKRT